MPTRKPPVPVIVARGPLANVYMCPQCAFSVRMPRGNPRGVGRAYGLTASSQCRAAVIRHFRAEHVPGPTR